MYATTEVNNYSEVLGRRRAWCTQRTQGAESGWWEKTAGSQQKIAEGENSQSKTS